MECKVGTRRKSASEQQHSLQLLSRILHLSSVEPPAAKSLTKPVCVWESETDMAGESHGRGKGKKNTVRTVSLPLTSLTVPLTHCRGPTLKGEARSLLPGTPSTITVRQVAQSTPLPKTILKRNLKWQSTYEPDGSAPQIPSP